MAALGRAAAAAAGAALQLRRRVLQLKELIQRGVRKRGGRGVRGAPRRRVRAQRLLQRRLDACQARGGGREARAVAGLGRFQERGAQLLAGV